MVVEMLPVPTILTERIALDRSSNVIYAERRFCGDPLLLTWQDKNRINGLSMQIQPVEIDELTKLRNEGFRVATEVDTDMVVRGQALEIIKLAAAYGASDIHFMNCGEHTEIQVVIKGGLRVLARKSQEEGEALVRAIYQGIAKTRDSSYNPLDFQNAQIPGDEFPADSSISSARIVRGPSYPQAKNASFMTIRLQYGSVQSAKKNNLPQLFLPRKPDGEFNLHQRGYTAKQITKIRSLMDAPNGVIFITGPVGSGKTSTLFEVLQENARTKPHLRLVTVEDPVEYPMSWAVQMPITGAKNDAETGAAYAERIRVALRMAPHSILLGELRGPDVAVAALEAAVTGHQIWTTMHVTDPFLFVERLELMDQVRLNRRIFCDHKVIRGVIAQRLLPQLCQNCSRLLSNNQNVLSKRIVLALGTWGDLAKVRIKGTGCEHCGYDGTTGRFAIAEVVVTDAALMRDFIKHGSDVARDNYRKKTDADKSMLETGIKYVLAGYLDPRTVEETIDLIEPNSKELNHVIH